MPMRVEDPGPPDVPQAGTGNSSGLQEGAHRPGLASTAGNVAEDAAEGTLGCLGGACLDGICSSISCGVLLVGAGLGVAAVLRARRGPRAV